MVPQFSRAALTATAQPAALPYGDANPALAAGYSALTTASQDYYLSLSSENLTDSLYFCRLTSGGKTETRRFVIQH